MDNFVAGALCLQDALLFCHELTELIELAGLELRKWASNTSEFLEGIPREHLSFPDDDQVVKILGLMWDLTSDCFRVRRCCFEGKFTKRSMLFYITRIFDSSGLLAPVVFWAKEFQALWKHHLEWDKPLPPALKESWLQYVELYQELETPRIPRQVS